MTFAEELAGEYPVIDTTGARKISLLHMETHEPIEDMREYQGEYRKRWRINKRARDRERVREKRAKVV